MGWQIKGTFDLSIKKSVVAVISHTSWHDFYIVLLVRAILDTQINFVGKIENRKRGSIYYYLVLCFLIKK